MLLALLIIARSVDNSGLGGFITFGFNYEGDKTQLLSQLTVNIKTPSPQNSNVDSADVLPTGYWIVQTPSQREVVVSVKSPDGVIIEPVSQYISSPYNSNVNFQIVGFSAIGEIYTADSSGSRIRVLSPLTVEVSDGKGFSITTTTNDGTYNIGPLLPGEYTVQLKDAVADPKKITVKTGSVKVDDLLITDWPQNGVVTFPDGVEPHVVKLSLSSIEDQKAQPMNVETDALGKFSIKGLQVGHYQLKSAIEDIVINPLSFQISVQDKPKPLTLKYEGIRVHGKVAYPKGDGLAKVEVLMTPGSYKTATNDNGEFVFTVTQPISQPQIEFFYPYHKFSEPTIPAIENKPIPKIIVNVLNAHICGKVECPSADLSFSGAIKASMTINNGSFCVSAPISQQVTIEAVSQCGFEHSSLTVSAPTNSVKFSRIKANVHCQAKCIGDCDTATQFLLKNNHYSYSTNILSNGNVVFNDIEFGTYQLSISSDSTSVWKVLQNDILVNDKYISLGDVAEQTSLVYKVTVSHEMDVKCGDENIHLKRGLNTINVRSTIIEPNDCHIFQTIDLKASDRIITDSIKRKVVVTGKEDVFTLYLNGHQLSPPYEFNQKMDEVAKVSIKTIAPYFSNPTEIEVKNVEACFEAPIHFEVLVGVEYAGSIIPPIEGVSVTAYLDGKVIATIQTEENGKFSLGSFSSNKNITLVAEKPGYKFNQKKGSFDFTSEKLSSVNIHFDSPQNINTKGVLLSISRLDNFAHHVITDSNNDTLISGLEAGNYFLKPIFREHEFDPPQIQFDLAEGSQINLSFSVIRTQFGINGEVKRITGEPEPDIEIEAHYGSGEKIITVTDKNGAFRIGGLNPNQTITLLPRASETSNVDRITPSQLKIKMGDEEYQGVRFLSMLPSKSFDILGELVIEPDFLPSMSLILLTPESQVVERFEFPSKLSNFFYFTNLTGPKYNIRVVDTRQLKSIKCPSQEVEFTQPSAKVRIVCELEESAEADETTDSRIASTISFVAILFWICFFNFNKVLLLIEEYNLWPKKKKGGKKQKKY